MSRWGDPNSHGRNYKISDAAADLGAAGGVGALGYRSWSDQNMANRIARHRRLGGLPTTKRETQLVRRAKVTRRGAFGLAAAGLLRRPLSTVVSDIRAKRPQSRSGTPLNLTPAQRSVTTRNDRVGMSGTFTSREKAILATAAPGRQQEWHTPVGRHLPEGSRLTDTGQVRPIHSFHESAEEALRRNRTRMKGPLTVKRTTPKPQTGPVEPNPLAVPKMTQAQREAWLRRNGR